MQPTPDDLRDHMSSLEKRLGEGALGLHALLVGADGSERSEVRFNSNRYFPMASVVKIPIAMSLVSEVLSGRVSFDETLTVQPARVCPGPPRNPLDRTYYQPVRAPRIVTLDELLRLMLVDSDNTAADVVLDRLGGPVAVSLYMRSRGIQEVNFGRTLSELLSFYYDLRLSGADWERWHSSTLAGSMILWPIHGPPQPPRTHLRPAGSILESGPVRK